jgi:hypothetical protein
VIVNAVEFPAGLRIVKILLIVKVCIKHIPTN